MTTLTSTKTNKGKSSRRAHEILDLKEGVPEAEILRRFRELAPKSLPEPDGDIWKSEVWEKFIEICWALNVLLYKKDEDLDREAARELYGREFLKDFFDIDPVGVGATFLNDDYDDIHDLDIAMKDFLAETKRAVKEHDDNANKKAVVEEPPDKAKKNKKKKKKKKKKGGATAGSDQPGQSQTRKSEHESSDSESEGDQEVKEAEAPPPKKNYKMTNGTAGPKKETPKKEASKKEAPPSASKQKKEAGSDEELDLKSAFVSKAVKKHSASTAGASASVNAKGAAGAQGNSKSTTKNEKQKKKSLADGLPEVMPAGRAPVDLHSKKAGVMVVTIDGAGGNVSESDKRHAEELFELGQKCASRNEECYYAAVAYHDEAIKVNPYEPKYYSARSFCRMKTGEYKEALEDAETYLEFFPSDARGFLLKGRALNALEEFPLAQDAFVEAVRLDPNYKLAVEELKLCRIGYLVKMGFTESDSAAALYMRDGDMEAAIELLVGKSGTPTDSPVSSPVVNATGGGARSKVPQVRPLMAAPVQPPLRPPVLTQPPPRAPVLTHPPPRAPVSFQPPPRGPVLTQPPPRAPVLTQPPPRAPVLTQPPPRAPLLTQPPPRAPASTQPQLSNIQRLLPPRLLAQQQQLYAQVQAAALAASQNSQGVPVPQAQAGVVHPPPTAARPKSPANPYEDPANPMKLCSVVVLNLPRANSTDVQHWFTSEFAKCGPIQSYKIIPEKKCGFVNFITDTAASNAVVMFNNLELEGSVLSVRFQPPKTAAAKRIGSNPQNDSRPYNEIDCAFWQGTGCFFGDSCRYRHDPLLKGKGALNP